MRLIKTKAERAAEHRRIERTLLAREAQREERLRTMAISAKVLTTHIASGFPVEFSIENETVMQVTSFLSGLREVGYEPRVYQKSTEKKDNVGKKGTFKSVSKVDGKNQWKYVFTVKGDGSAEQIVTGFTATQYRVGDFVRFGKNDKGYMEAAIITPEDFQDSRTDDMPF